MLKLERTEVVIAILLMFMPLCLILINGEVRSSISNYAYSLHHQYFYLQLFLAAFLFFYNGTIKHKHWYNKILGIALLGVGLTPHLDYPVLHYFSAGLFFVGSCVSMPLSSSKKFLFSKMIASFIVAFALVLHFAFGLFSLFTAEWIALVPICIHFIIKNLD